MTILYDWLCAPFMDYAFMRHALVGAWALSLSCPPLGILLQLRRMSLMGDSISHAILPGAVIGFIIQGTSLWAMSLGGLVAALVVALLGGWLSRQSTLLKEDASLAGLFSIALALGVMLISLYATNQDLNSFLFGNILSVTTESLTLAVGVSIASLCILALAYRPLVMQSFDPPFLRAVSRCGGFIHSLFLGLVVINLVAGFQTLGSLMVVGLMMLPAISARLWCQSLGWMSIFAVIIACVSSTLGLLLSYHLNTPSGPAIILCAGAIYGLSILFGKQGGILRRYLYRHHLEA